MTSTLGDIDVAQHEAVLHLAGSILATPKQSAESRQLETHGSRYCLNETCQVKRVGVEMFSSA